MLAGGLFGTLVGVRSERIKLPTAVTSLISASYYVGFLVGSRATLRGLGRVGHIRVYSALASLLAAAMIGAGITQSPVAWGLLRLVTGLCTAGLYVIAESWLNDLATNSNRGRLLAVYGVVTVAFFGIGQAAIVAFNSQVVTGFAVAAILTSVAVAPVALSEAAVAPGLEHKQNVTLRELAKMVPTGVFSALLVGMAHGAIAGMAAVYATRAGLSRRDIGFFVALPSLGGMVLQWPISAASDEVDRRFVGLATAFAAAGVAALLLLTPSDSLMGFGLIALLGGLSYPLYSIAGAYTNDWVPPANLNAAASQLVTLYGMGAVVGPFVVAGAMIAIGPHGFFWALIALHSVIAVFFCYRLFAWRSPLVTRPWSQVSLPARAFFVPATIIAFGVRRGRKLVHPQKSRNPLS